MTEDALCAESREGTTMITIENTMTQVKSRLMVSYRGSVVWAFPLEECQTWTVSFKLPGLMQAGNDFTDLERTFSRTFGNSGRDVWFSSYKEAQYMRRTGPGSSMGLNALARIWPSMLILGKPESSKPFIVILPSSYRIQAQFKDRPDPKPPPRRLEQLLDDTQTLDTEGATQKQDAGLKVNAEQSKRLSPDWKPDVSNGANSIPRLESVSIFAFLEGVPQPAGVDRSVLNEHLLEVEDFLLNQTNFTDRKAYRGCNPSSRKSVHGILQKRGSVLSQSSDSSGRDQIDYEEDVDIFNTADVIFRFFFPADTMVATVAKFWGAVRLMIEVSGMVGNVSSLLYYNAPRG